MTTNDGAQSPIAGARCPVILILLGLIVPTGVTWVYFELLSSSPESIQKIGYLFGKSTQCALPIIAYWFWLRRGIFNGNSRDKAGQLTENAIQLPAWRAFVEGVVSGIVIGVVMIAVYFSVLLPLGAMETVRLEGQKKLSGFGLDSPVLFLGLGLFYSLLHSGFEEFYWRRFVFVGLLQRVSFASAIAISSIGFMGHHVIVLGRYFGWSSPFAYLCSIGVAVGGAIWGWMYRRSSSIIPSWISHAIVDAAIFLIGYHLIFQQR